MISVLMFLHVPRRSISLVEKHLEVAVNRKSRFCPVSSWFSDFSGILSFGHVVFRAYGIHRRRNIETEHIVAGGKPVWGGAEVNPPWYCARFLFAVIPRKRRNVGIISYSKVTVDRLQRLQRGYREKNIKIFNFL